MKENDIARKCAGALIGIGALVGLSVLASWWGFPSEPAVEPVLAVSRETPFSSTTIALQQGEPRPALAAPEVAAASTDEQDRLARKTFQLEMDNARLRGRLDDMVNWILDNVRGTFPLPEGQMAYLRLMPVDTNMAVSDDLAQLLRLNDEEVNRLDAAFQGTKSLLQELETENISVENPSENQVVLNIPPYAEDGQLVREELLIELKSTLGAARFNRFLQVAGLDLDEKFEFFGEVDRTLLFEAVRDALTGNSQLFVRDERVVPNRDDPLRQDITASERIVTELPAEYYAYRNWLPETVTRFSTGN